MPPAPGSNAATRLVRMGSRRRAPVGRLVLGSIVVGLALGLLLVLVVFSGGSEAEITGSALVALGIGFALLALGSIRFSDQPQPWAFSPGVASTAVGLAVIVLSPSDHILGLAGWFWPGLLLVLVG